MNPLQSSRLRRVALVIVLAAVAAGAAWTFRASMGTPAAEAEPGAAATDHSGHDMTGGAGLAGEPATTARATVNVDPRRQQLIGVRTVAAERTDLSRTVRTVGVVKYDETRLADVNLKLDGWIDELYVDSTGQLVRQGEPLFTLYSPDLVATQNEYLLALRTRGELGASALPDARAYADRLVEAARRRLELWDLGPDEVAELERSGAPRRHVVFRAPASGFVVEKAALRGQHVSAGQTLYRLADLSVVWVEADLYEQDLAFVRVGDRASLTLDAYPGEPVIGRVIYIYPFADEPARTVRARFAVANPRQRFRPGMYAGVELQSSLGMGVTVPTDAVLDSGGDQLVFLSEGDGYFTPRRVEVGHRLTSRVEIRHGLSAGDVVATGAPFFLDSESQLRAAIPGFEAPPPVEPGAAPAGALAIEFTTRPDPPRAGDNTVEVRVREAGGAPVTDATVTLTLFMPAMPSMNMPAMRSDVALVAAGGGLYRGQADVSAAGRWDVTIVVARDGRTIGRATRAIVAR